MFNFCRRYLWDLMEKPWTSDAAQCYAVMSMMVVLVSTITFVVSTLENEEGEETHPFVLITIEVIDIVCVIIFSLEYVIRLLCAPQKLVFFREPMNLGK